VEDILFLSIGRRPIAIRCGATPEQQSPNPKEYIALAGQPTTSPPSLAPSNPMTPGNTPAVAHGQNLEKERDGNQKTYLILFGLRLSMHLV
jgi:hypothetical protein